MTSGKESALEAPTVSSFTSTVPRRRSRLTNRRRSTRFACTGRKGGKCTGDKCRVFHKSDKDRTPSPSRPSGIENAAPAAADKPRAPSPAPKRKPGRGRSKSPRPTPAACCVHAAAASTSGYVPQRKGARTKVVKKVLFVSRPETRSIPTEGRGGKLVHRPRRYSTCYADQANCPKSDRRDARFAAEAARLLEQAVKAMLQKIPSPYTSDCPNAECEDFGTTCRTKVHGRRLHFLLVPGTSPVLCDARGT